MEMADIRYRLLANPVGRFHLSAVTDDRGGASRLEIDAFTSTIVFVECRQKRDIDEPCGFERFSDELFAGLFPMPGEVRVCDGFVIVAAVRQPARIVGSTTAKVLKVGVDSCERLSEVVVGRIIKNLPPLPCSPIHVGLAPAAYIVWIQPARELRKELRIGMEISLVFLGNRDENLGVDAGLDKPCVNLGSLRP